jgi:hypothetical protein
MGRYYYYVKATDDTGREIIIKIVDDHRSLGFVEEVSEQEMKEQIKENQE